mmetsp:Transcript_41033/g.97495  ORF Transcript_41033/g.97495 Transcript_41033/m.97495 type:complete len:416 (+) Transcript_41033:320-1567(+)
MTLPEASEGMKSISPSFTNAASRAAWMRSSIMGAPKSSVVLSGMSSSRLRMFSLLKRGFWSPTLCAILAKPLIGRRTLEALTGRRPEACSRLPSALMGSRSHCSRSSSHLARRCTLATSSAGTKASITRVFRAICCVSIRSESIMSSRSRWISWLMSSTSCFTCRYLAHSFFSLAPFWSASCCIVLYVSSLASCSSSSLARRSWSERARACLSSSSRLFFSTSSAVSSTTPFRPTPFCSPMRIFDCMASSFFWSASFCSAAFLACSAAAALSSSFVCASVMSFAASRRAFSFSASSFWSSSFACFSASSRIRASSSSSRFSAEMFALSSASISRFMDSISLSSIGFSFSTTFSTMRSSSVGSPPSEPACSSSALRRLISSWNSRSMASLGSSLMRGLFLMFFARLAYRSVLRVSS